MRHPTEHRREERGAVMVLAALLIVVVGAFMALALNTGHGVAIKGELQNAADAAALAGVRDINGSLTAITTARGSANTFAGRHFTDPRLPVAAETVEFGNWDPGASAWTPLAPAVENLYRLNAIRVVTSRKADVAGGGAVDAWFGRAFLKRDTFEVSASAIAFAGAPCPSGDGCNSPFVIRYGCLVTGDLRCNDHFAIGASSATIDTAGLADPTETGPNVNTNGMCRYTRTASTTTCAQGDEIATTNGNSITSTCGGSGGPVPLCTLIRQMWPAGHSMRIPVVIYPGDNDPMSCLGSGAGQYGGRATIITSMKATVVGVWCNDAQDVLPRTGKCVDAHFSAGMCIGLHTECDDSNQTPGACVALGTVTVAPKLAR